MNILVTGACGFIGSYVCKSLVNDGHAVFGFDDFSNSTEECKQLSFAACKAVVEASVLNGQSIEKALRDFNIDLVVHLAAKPGVEWSTEHPSDCMNTNVVGTENVLDAMRKAFVPDIIFVSSSTVYSGLSPYGLSKQFGEKLVEMHSKLYRFQAIALRLFSAYGPRMRNDLAMCRLADSTRVDKAVFCVRGDATQMFRDYTYVEDVA